MTGSHADGIRGFPAVVTIAGQELGGEAPVYLIAEAGSNHDRDLPTALRLVDAAADAGCDAVKFQTFEGPDIASSFVSPGTELPTEYHRYGKNLRDFYAAIALPTEFHEPLASRAAERGIHFLSSPFSEAAIDRLVEVGVPALKLASFEIGHVPLIRYAAASGLPLLISTGTATMADIERALEAVSDGGGREVALLHCGSSYPLPIEQANLRAITTMQQAFGVPVGYSDHTLGLTAPTAAATLGAALIEKHFTLGRDGDGPDHPFALEPDELGALASAIRGAHLSLGSGHKTPSSAEREHHLRGRRSIHAARDLSTGEALQFEDLKVVRPSTGLAPHLLDVVIGRQLVRDVSAERPVTWDDLLR